MVPFSTVSAPNGTLRRPLDSPKSRKESGTQPSVYLFFVFMFAYITFLPGLTLMAPQFEYAVQPLKEILSLKWLDTGASPEQRATARQKRTKRKEGGEELTVSLQFCCGLLRTLCK